MRAKASPGWFFNWQSLLSVHMGDHKQCPWCKCYYDGGSTTHAHNNPQQCRSKTIKNSGLPSVDGHYFCLICFYTTTSKDQMAEHYAQYDKEALESIGYTRTGLQPPQRASRGAQGSSSSGNSQRRPPMPVAGQLGHPAVLERNKFIQLCSTANSIENIVRTAVCAYRN